MKRRCTKCQEEKDGRSFAGDSHDMCKKCERQNTEKQVPEEKPTFTESLPGASDFEELVSLARQDPEYFNEIELNSYEDYRKHNELIRKLRMRLRKSKKEEKSALHWRYCPIELAPCQKVCITRTSNRGKPINLNLRRPGLAIWLQEEYDDGEEVMMPTPMIPEILKLAEPKYKQLKRADGTGETVFDYWDNKYNCNPVF